ncbi:MAG: PLDc N-terminal domain-containing protein [bacterium]
MNDQAAGAIAGLLGIGFFLLIGLFAVAVLAFWIWMLVDCIQREFGPNEQNAKVIWILVLVLAGWLGAIIYYFVVKRARPNVSLPRPPS